jgi:hypothetical protein
MPCGINPCNTARFLLLPFLENDKMSLKQSCVVAMMTRIRAMTDKKSVMPANLRNKCRVEPAQGRKSQAAL